MIGEQITLTKTKVTVLDVAVKTTATGVKITVKSDVLESFFKEHAQRDVRGASFATNDMRAYRLTDGTLAALRTLDGNAGWKFDRIEAISQGTGSLFAGAGVSDLSLLRFVGVGAGVTITLTTPHTKQTLEEWAAAAQRAAQAIYRMHMKPVAFKITVISEHIA
jgi:hypothetical protein